MALPASLFEAIESALAAEGFGGHILGAKPVTGGCIHNAQRVETDDRAFFVKYNDISQADNFAAEIAGLEALHGTSAIKVPQPITSGVSGNHAFLIMEWIESARPKKDFWNTFATQLSRLHANSQAEYGFGANNYIGSLPQVNPLTKSGHEFFIEHRLEYQLRLAERSGRVSSNTRMLFEKLYTKIPELIPDRPPSLIHGDLWSGNFMAGENGEPVIFDPAVYYGHPEADLAMMHLFGGFDRMLFERYEEESGIEKDWRERIDLFNLYPLMVHVNLFGGGYLSQVHSILERYV